MKILFIYLVRSVYQQNLIAQKLSVQVLAAYVVLADGLNNLTH